MAIALFITDRNLTRLSERIKQQLPEVDVQCWPNITSPENVTFAVCWKQPKNIWQTLPNLKAVSSFGAGCDGILQDNTLPDNVTVTRIVDPNLATQMAEYVLLSIMLQARKITQYYNHQQQKQWHPIKRMRGNKVTILGVGQIGSVVAHYLQQNGYQVTGWANSPKPNATFPVYLGQSELVKAINSADFVVNLLPLTPKTKGLINRELFKEMLPSSYFINVGRGLTVCEKDLIQAIEQQEIAGAMLDVFEQEPLNPNSKLWTFDNVIITPHIAAITSQQTVIDQLCDNYHRMTEGLSLKHTVCRKRGY